MRKTILDGGINWNWYLCADFNETERTAHIYFYERWHKYEDRGMGHPPNAEWISNYCILEDKNREVYGIRLNTTEYLVTNPKYVFNYKDFSPLAISPITS